MVCALVVLFQKFFPSYLEIMKIFYYIFLKSISLHFTFKSLNNLEYIFVYGMRWKHNIILFHKYLTNENWDPECRTK